MTRKCCVAGCYSGYSSNNLKCKENGRKCKSLFKVPKCEEQRKKWETVLALEDRKLTINDGVCEIHFRDDDIIKYDETILPDGSTYKIERVRYRLTPGAIPIADTQFSKKKIEEIPASNHCDHNYAIPRKEPSTQEQNLNPWNTGIHTKTPPDNNVHFSNTDTTDTIADRQTRQLSTEALILKYPNTVLSSNENEMDTTVPQTYDRNDELPVDESDQLQQTRKCYGIKNLELDLEKFKLPKKWAYIPVSDGILLSHLSTGATVDINLFIYKNMKMKILTGDQQVSLETTHKFNLFNDVISYLPYLEKLADSPCQGIGIDNMRAKNCSGFCLDGSVLKRLAFIRCLPCRLFRKRKRDQDARRQSRSEKTKKNKADLLKSMKRQKSRLKIKVFKLKKTIEAARKAISTVQDEVINKKIAHLPASQQEAVQSCLAATKVKSSTGRRYTKSWIYECLMLRIKSRKAYEHIRTHKILPLSSIDTLNRYIKHMDTAYGFQDYVFKGLKNKSKDMRPEDRRGTLLIDEMKLTEGISFDRQYLKYNGFTDLGNHTPQHQKNQLGDHALVMMFQPFRGQWVQAMACFLSKGCASSSVLHNLIIECIILTERARFHIDVVTTDGAQWNRSMWKLFGINEHHVSCVHPYDESRRLWFCSDFPHLIKNFRNSIVAHPETWTPDGIVKLKHWRALLSIESPESYGLKVAYKLTENHLSPKYYPKMNVPLAFQLFSSPVRVAMEVYSRCHPDLSDCKPTIRFIKRLDNLITSMMSRTSKSALRVDSDEYKAISDFLEYLNNWEKAATEKGYYFLTDNTCCGLKVTLQASLEIIHFLNEACDFDYMMTSRLNQDVLERFFGMMRGACGSNDHPDSLLFAQVFRLMSTYSLMKPPKGSNVAGPEFFKTLLNIEDVKKIRLLKKVPPNFLK